MPRVTRSSDIAVRTCTAVYGAAVGIAIAPALQGPAGRDSLPGGIVSAGLSPAGPMLQLAAVVAGVVLFAFLGGIVVPLAAHARWVTVGFCVAMASAPVTLMHFGTMRHVILHGAVGAGILATRRLEPRFSRHDIVLLPLLLSCYFAFLDIGFGKTAIATFLRATAVVFVLRLVVGAVTRMARPGLAFTAAPLALLLQLQWLSPGAGGVLALIWLLGSPFALAFVSERKLVRFAAYLAYPLIAFAYPLALLGATSPPSADFFEDTHSVIPAAEMFRGERPYRDIIPMHGFLSDGGLDLLSMKLGAASLGPILRMHLVVGSLSAMAIYFVALAATGSASAALLAVFLALALFPSEVVWLRAVTALLALACCVAATRLRARRWFLAAGALAALTFLVSLDLAVYTALVALVAAARARAVRPLVAGAAAVAALTLLIFALFGLAGELLRVTATEVLTNGGVYLIGRFAIPDCLRSATVLVEQFGDPQCLVWVIWCIALVGCAVVFSRSPLRARRADAVWYVALWMVLAAVSYVERMHLYFVFGLAAFVVGTVPLLRRRSRTMAVALTILLVFLARPFSHVFDVATPLRRTNGSPVGGRVAFSTAPRARGVLFDPDTHRALAATQRFITASLRPNETFFDFANAGLLYYLFDRDCPIRQMEVPMYEREAAQREVIATLEGNRRIRAALIVFPSAYSAIDGVSNRDRAPLVWHYLQQHFMPAFDEDGVAFWLRKE